MLKEGTVLTATPLEDAIKLVFETMLPTIEAKIEAAMRKDAIDKLLSPAAACEVFEPKISKVTLAAWTENSRIPVQGIGGRLYYKYSDLMHAVKTIHKYKKA